jgi:hypothetical protein
LGQLQQGTGRQESNVICTDAIAVPEPHIFFLNLFWSSLLFPIEEEEARRKRKKGKWLSGG